MALVEELNTRLNLYLDEEGDFSAVDNAQRSLWLQDAYREFISFVTTIDPSIFTATANYAGAASINLSTTAPIILGANVPPAVPRLLAVTAISVVDAAGDTVFVLRRAANRAELDHYASTGSSSISGVTRYFLQGSVLLFSEDLTGDTVRVEYIGEPVVDWTQLAAGTNEFVETLGLFDDAVALLAVKQYNVFANSESEAHARQLDARLRALSAHLYGRDEGNRYIIEIGDGW